MDDMPLTLESFGVTDRQRNEALMYDGLVLGRVTAQYRGRYRAVTDAGECFCGVSGKLRYAADESALFPAVGDYVMLQTAQEDGDSIIQAILTRKSAFIRRAAGTAAETQIVAANIDNVFICMSLNANYNLSRLERYLSVAWDSGAVPVIILTKADLCESADAAQKYISEAERVSSYSDVIAVSAFDETTAEKLMPYITGRTVAFIGSSGVGKSTLINLLLGRKALETQDIGYMDKGRHTTTGRELFACRGGVLIDTPGMRGLAVESADLSSSFDDIEALAQECRFADCSHKNEPGCAVKRALGDGTLDARRYENYLKLRNELSYDGLAGRELEKRKLERIFSGVGGMKNMRKSVRENDKRKK